MRLFFLILSQLSSMLSIPFWQLTVSMHQIRSRHPVQPTCQIDGQNDNSVLTVVILMPA